MNFIDFQKTFKTWPLVPVFEIEKNFPGFDHNALTRWQRAGYIEKLRNGYYRFSDQKVEREGELFFIANRIYHPSYVSLQSALSWHGLIPEGVFTVTSVSTLKTQTFQTPVGRFSWSHLKPELFFGYQLETFGQFNFKIADPEKALLDHIYLRPELANLSDFYELRLNYQQLREKFSRVTFDRYLTVFNSQSLNKRVTPLLKLLSENDAID